MWKKPKLAYALAAVENWYCEMENMANSMVAAISRNAGLQSRYRNRQGALVTQLLRKWNGFELHLKVNELSDMFIAIADGQADKDILEIWLQSSFRRIREMA